MLIASLSEKSGSFLIRLDRVLVQLIHEPLYPALVHIAHVLCPVVPTPALSY